MNWPAAGSRRANPAKARQNGQWLLAFFIGSGAPSGSTGIQSAPAAVQTGISEGAAPDPLIGIGIAASNNFRVNRAAVIIAMVARGHKPPAELVAEAAAASVAGPRRPGGVPLHDSDRCDGIVPLPLVSVIAPTVLANALQFYH